MSHPYRTKKIPNDLLDTIDFIIKNAKLGYRNESEFIMESIRDKIVGIFALYPDLKTKFESMKK